MLSTRLGPKSRARRGRRLSAQSRKIDEGLSRIAAAGHGYPKENTGTLSPALSTRFARATPAPIRAKQFSATTSPQARRRKCERWRKVGIPTSRDIRALRPPSLPRGQRFETPSDAARVNADTVAKLSNLLPDIAAAIESCEGEGAPCSLPCCAVCARRYWGYHTSELLRIANMYEGPHEIATIYLETVDEGDLSDVNINRAHARLSKRLKRAGLSDAILLGGTEANWISQERCWILHIHALAIGVPHKVWARLRKNLEGDGIKIPLKVQPLRDGPRQLSYVQKFVSLHRPLGRGANGPGRPFPLPPTRRSELAAWWAKHRFEDFGFLFGARRRGGRIVPDA
jgi:hypothetical protein